MNTPKNLLSFLIIAFTLISCNPTTQFEESTEVRLESEKESFTSSEQTQLMLVNDTNKVLYLNFCGSLLYILEVKENENWIRYAGGFCLALYEPKFIPVLEPGETMKITIRHSLDAGQYRYNLAYKLSSAESDPKEISVEFLVE